MMMSGPYENVEMKNAHHYKHGRVSHNQKKVLQMAVIHGPARCYTAMCQGVSLHVKAGGVRLDLYLKKDCLVELVCRVMPGPHCAGIVGGKVA